MELYDPMGNVVNTERPVTYGGFWARFGASLLDSLILGIPLSIINWTMMYGLLVMPIFLNIVINWIYFASMESGPKMATLGKRALGLKVTDMHGGRITFMQATGRFFGKYISAIILLIGYLMMLWDDQSQTLHDKMANTLVVTE